MAENIFDKWEKEFDYEGLRKDLDEASNNGGNTFKEVPSGTYEVTVEKMELIASKKGDPMVSIWFKIVAGEFKNSRIFYNQLVTGRMFSNGSCDIGIAIHFLKQFELEAVKACGESWSNIFKNHRQFSNLLMDCAEEIDAAKLSFQLEYGEGKNGFHTYSITDVFEN